MKISLIICLFVLSVGCMKIVDDPQSEDGTTSENSPQPQDPTSTSETPQSPSVSREPQTDVSSPSDAFSILEEKDITLKIVPLSQPQNYQVKFTWPQCSGHVTLYDGFSAVASTPCSAKGIQWSVNTPDQHTFSLLQTDFADREVKKLSFETTIPKDVVFESKIEPTQDLSIEAGRVFLKLGTIITMNQHHLTIKAAEILAEGAIIQTWDEGDKASPGQAGLDGGHIQIEVQRAIGQLEVFLRGQIGGNGYDGSQPSQANKGADGNDAKYSFDPIHFNPPTCISKPTPGEDGAIGLSGSAGTDGQTGGASGNFVFKVSESSKIKITPHVWPGGGGEGGHGGLGGLGGPGGKEGSDPMIQIRPEVACSLNPSLPGHQGPSGPSGPNGKDGKSGEMGLLLIQYPPITLSK